MSGRELCGALGAILGLVALVAGIADWTLNVKVVPNLDSDINFLYALADLAWLVWIVASGGALILIGVSAALPVRAAAGEALSVPAPAGDRSPPPIPDAPPGSPREKEETRAAADLWQSEHSPFPAPPRIEHPSEGPDLWQSDKAPFPKVEVPGDGSPDDEERSEEERSEEERKEAERARWGS